MKSFIIYFSKKGSVEQLFNQAWYLFPEEYLFRIQYWASRRMCWLNKNVNLLKNVYFLSYLKAYFVSNYMIAYFAHFPLTDEAQNPNKTRQLFPLAYQLANDLFWVFSVLKLELMKPLLLMVFGFGHGFLSKIYFWISLKKKVMSLTEIPSDGGVSLGRLWGSSSSNSRTSFSDSYSKSISS